MKIDGQCVSNAAHSLKNVQADLDSIVSLWVAITYRN